MSLKNPRIRLYLAWVMFVGSIIGWPLSAFTFAREEPQAILALSWGAMFMTAWDIISTAEVRVKQEEEGV